ncbi:MAG: lytic transglycosylase domain-containing protein, partial [Acidobacteriota bacterium]
AERLIQSIPPDLPFPLLPRALQELLYPLGYFPLVEASTAPRGVDKFLVTAVIREESRFHAQAKSVASARGLMQLIPSTARQMGNRLGLRRFSVEDLYRPPLNIELGVEHLKELLEEFPGNLFAAIASYNAGKNVVRQWLANCSTAEPEELILEIKFEETKKFVQRVMRSYWRYKEIYGDGMN